MAFQNFKVSLNLPFGIGGVAFDVTETQRAAAWRLYVEFASRVTAQPIAPDTSSIREALTSLYGLLNLTRKVLTEAGPEVAPGPESLGAMALRVAAEGLRPFLMKWQSALGAFEDEQRDAQRTSFGGNTHFIIDESAFLQRDEFYRDVASLQEDLKAYTDQLADVAKVRSALGS